MATNDDHATRAREAIRQAIAPLETIVAELTTDIQTMELELSKIRESRMAALKMLRLADPIAAERYAPKPGPKTKSGSGHKGIKGGASQDAVEAWLRANAAEYFPKGFMAKDLFAIRDRIGVVRSLPAFNAYLLNMANAGAIRLDHVNDNGGKVYKVPNNG